MSQRPFAFATRSTASSSPRSRASSAAERPTKPITFALPSRARSAAKSATSTRSRFAASITANCTATATRPRGGPPSMSIPLPIALELWKCSQLGATAEDRKTNENPSVSVRADDRQQNGNHETPANPASGIQRPRSGTVNGTDWWAQEPMIGSTAEMVSHPFS